MDALSLLTRSSEPGFTPEEEAVISNELSAAYHRDEVSSTSRDVQRIAEKVRSILLNNADEPESSAARS